jgi:ankyrin repeat protein
LTILNILLKHSVDVNAKARVHGTALYAASVRGNKECVAKLLQAGASPDWTEDGALGNPLHAAAFHGHDDVIREILQNDRFKVDHSAAPFGTALQAASASSKPSAVKVLLLEFKGDPNIIDRSLRTAVQAALSQFVPAKRGGVPDK